MIIAFLPLFSELIGKIMAALRLNKSALTQERAHSVNSITATHSSNFTQIYKNNMSFNLNAHLALVV